MSAIPGTGKIYVVSHTQAQLQHLIRSQRLEPKRVVRVSRVDHVRGLRPWQLPPLLLLTYCYDGCRGFDEILAIWHHGGGKTLHVSDSVVEGEERLCAYDTDGDGNCHLCAESGGCFFLKP